MDISVSGGYDKVGVASISNANYSTRYGENVECEGRDWRFLSWPWTCVVEKFSRECGYVFGSGDCAKRIGYVVLDGLEVNRGILRDLY